MTPRMQELLDRIRDDVREAVLEGDAQDCSSADCIADATYEIVRFALRDYLLVSEAELAAALDRSDLIRRYDEYSRDAHPETMRPTPRDELARTWAAAIFAALSGAAQEKGEAG